MLELGFYDYLHIAIMYKKLGKRNEFVFNQYLPANFPSGVSDKVGDLLIWSLIFKAISVQTTVGFTEFTLI